MASVLDEFAAELEKSKKKSDTMLKLIIDTYKAHKRVIFNGNGYSEEWKEEAARRGLPNITNNVDAIKEILKPEAIEVFERMNVLTRQELEARYNIYLQPTVYTLAPGHIYKLAVLAQDPQRVLMDENESDATPYYRDDYVNPEYDCLYHGQRG